MLLEGNSPFRPSPGLDDVPRRVYHPVPTNRHRTHGQQSHSQLYSIERSRIVTEGRKRYRVPIRLEERPDWCLSGTKDWSKQVGDWSELSNIHKTCKELVTSKQVETRLHAAFALARCSQNQKNREKLAMTPGVLEAISHIMKHAEPSESGRRCQLHALTVLHNILLINQKIDVFIGHDENVISGLQHCLLTGPLPIQEIAITCLDYISILPDNQPVVCFKQGMLEMIAHLLQTTTSGYIVYHGLHTLTYLTTSRRTHHSMARSPEVMHVLLDTLSEHQEDPARCQQGLIALCNLMSLPDNAGYIQKTYNIVDLLAAITDHSRDDSVLSYCNEVLQRLQPTGRGFNQEADLRQHRSVDVVAGGPPTGHTPTHPSSPHMSQQVGNDAMRDVKGVKELSTPVPTPSRLLDYQPSSVVSNTTPHEMNTDWKDSWDAFDQKWETMKSEVLGKKPPPNSIPTVSVSAPPPSSQPAVGETGDTLALLDKYEAELNATIAEIERDSGPDLYQSIPLNRGIGGRQISPPRQQHGSLAPRPFSELSPSIASDMWSVSGESDI
eukprot:TRINITY_DN5933_c5_g1_i1.p1 TRINITY_DN5933_c5_g1~~TRINITY_DN5933_c5_g1_i1.p1  ORF type:complete len:563 (+),score=69.94 TRINITY_DN5933_c5_g1_i1:31-1689(+)